MHYHIKFFFELIIVFLCSTTIYTKIYFQFFHYLFSISLGYFLIYPITFVFWEFFQFNWIKQKNPYQSISKLFYFWDTNENNENEKNDNCMIIGLISFSIIIFAYLILFDKIIFYIIIWINLLKYILILLLYFFHCIIIILNIYISDLINYLQKKRY